jgi:YtxH-like protein
MPTSVPMLRDRFRRGRAGAGSASASAPTDPTSAASTAAGAARGRSYEESRDWAGIGMFGAGILVGALLGAGAALLYAPQSGIETRLDMSRKARRLRAEAGGRWDEVAGGVRRGVRQGTKRVRRSATRARWATADAFDA